MKHWRDRSGLARSLGKVHLIVGLALGAGVSLAGCATEAINNPDSEEVGSLGLNLKVVDGVNLTSVEYTIEGNDFQKTGTIDTSGAPVISGTMMAPPPTPVRPLNPPAATPVRTASARFGPGN